MTPNPKSKRISLKGKAWETLREEVFQRDRYRCRNCDELKPKNFLCPHHVKTKGSGGDDAPDNLLTLCSECHVKVHTGEITKHEVYEAMKQVIQEQNLSCDEYDIKIQELCRRLNI